MSPDYSTWLTKQQAADAIGVSTKTIEQFAKDQKIQQAAWKPSGRGPDKAVYHPDDVARLASERRPAPAPFVLPAGSTRPPNGNGHHALLEQKKFPAETPTGEDVLRLVFAAALRQLTAEPPAPSESSEKLFLTLPEASAVTGLSSTFLKRMITGGTLTAIKDRGWKIRRKDLEAL